MKFSFNKNAAFILFVVLLSVSFTSCMNEDNWIDWKNLNEKWHNAHKNDDGFTLLPSGVSYKILNNSTPGNPADGKPQSSSSYVTVNYKGRLFNDYVFDEGTNTDFVVGYTVSGFREVLMKMHPGDSCEIRIPWDQGYGEDGSGSSIPPYSTLKFNVRLNSFLNPQ